ncbi:MAG TPA: hypothetical protein VJ741_12890 [Solirubrobacteraceae bacterium]|nr:hypothetical protein [Solirubrobacteraceae bacterium]
MSAYAPYDTSGEPTSTYTGPLPGPDTGWITFAGTLLLLLGVMDVIYGIAAIGNAHFFVRDTSYVIGSLNTWGWVTLCLGVVELAVGVGVFFRNQIARWVGVVGLSIGAIVALLEMPAYPLWGLTLFAVNIVAVYALAAHGARAD